jgi:hypothetical protein
MPKKILEAPDESAYHKNQVEIDEKIDALNDKFRELVLKLQIDEYLLQSSRGDTYHKYKAIVNTEEKSTTHVTAENIHEVKVVLLFDRQFHDISKDGRKWKYSPFKILHPH